MLRLRTFGGLSIERPDRPAPASGATAARRRLALLAVLAANGARGVPRDKLLVFFWPESDTERARHALDQALYALKRDLGNETLVLGREELSLNPAAITSDVGDFRTALERGDCEAAVALYTGSFLDGVYLAGAPEFERWVDEERARVTRDVEAALETLAREATARADHESAVRWWQQLTVMNPRRTRAVVALMSELAETGDRASALRHANIYETLVRDDLEAEPNPAVAALAQKLRQEPVAAGTRQESVISRAANDATQDAGAVSSDALGGSAVPIVGRRTMLHRLGRGLTQKPRFGAGVVATAVVLAVPLAWLGWGRRAAGERSTIVLADLDDRTRDAIFASPLQAAMLAGLQQSNDVAVLARSRVQQTLTLMGHSPPETASMRVDESLAREVAEREGIKGVVVTTIDQIDSNYIITARIIDAESGDALAAATRVARRRGEVIDSTQNLVRQLHRTIGELSNILAKHQRPRLPEVTTRSLEALRKYAQGTAALRAARPNAARELWREAVALDSDFALAHAELGAAYYLEEDRQTGDAHFDRALSLLNRLSERERLLVRATVESWRGNREHAIDLRRALLDEHPTDSTAWSDIAYDYLRLGRPREAIAALRQQLARDPMNPRDYIRFATAYTALGDFDNALANFRRAFALQPTFLTLDEVNHEYGRALVLAGRPDDARAVYDGMRSGSTDQHASGERSLGLLAMAGGHYAEAIDHFRRATLLSQSGHRELNEARNRLLLAVAEQEKGRLDSARAELLVAHSLFRRVYFEPMFLMYLGKALARDGQLAPAVEVLDTLTKRVQPGNLEDRASQLVVSGEIQLARGREDTAVTLFELAYATDSNAAVEESLAQGLVRAGDARAALQLYDALSRSPQRWYGGLAEQYGLLASSNTAHLYERLGDTARARVAFDRLVGLWARGDSDLVHLREARERVAALQRKSPGLISPR